MPTLTRPNGTESPPRWRLVAATDADGEVPPDDVDDDETGTEPVEAGEAETKRMVLTVEGLPSGDGRLFEPGSITWAQLPLPFMADDETHEAHNEAKLIANLIDIERVVVGEGSEIIGTIEFIPVNGTGIDADRVRHLQELVRTDKLPTVSVDYDSVTVTMTDEGFEVSEDGTSMTIDSDAVREIYSEARVIGATAVPFPAFQEARSVAASLVAALRASEQRAITAAAHAGNGHRFPITPPRAHFEPITADSDVSFLDIDTDTGQVVGYVAEWDSCHIGYSAECVPPPRSATGYRFFHHGTIITEDEAGDGTRVRVGQLTFGGGHADANLPMQAARQHYDDVGWAVADICVGENERGIWLTGSMRPDVDLLTVRKVLAADVSGDWRLDRASSNLEMCALASVNVPGYVKRGVTAHVAAGVVESFIVTRPTAATDCGCGGTCGCDDSTGAAAAERVRQRIARSIGLDRETIVGQLARRVNGDG